MVAVQGIRSSCAGNTTGRIIQFFMDYSGIFHVRSGREKGFTKVSPGDVDYEFYRLLAKKRRETARLSREDILKGLLQGNEKGIRA